MQSSFYHAPIPWDYVQCPHCGEWKSLQEFSKANTRKSGHHPWCKSCQREYGLAYQAANREKIKPQKAAYYAANREHWVERRNALRAADPEKIRQQELSRHLRRHYGMTIPEWQEMFNAQGELCAICGTATPGKDGWVVDHCHTCKRNRGILCKSCNSDLLPGYERLPQQMQEITTINAYLGQCLSHAQQQTTPPQANR